MFNQAFFNRAGFNLLPEQSSLVSLHTYAVEAITTQTLPGAYLHLTAAAFERISSEARGVLAVRQREEVCERIETELILLGMMRLKATAGDAVTSAVTMGADIHLAAQAEEQVEVDLILGADLHIQARSAERLATDFTLGANLMVRTNAFELLATYADIYATEILTTLLSVTVPPGGRLILDSAGWVVLLDGEDITYLHEGDWVHIDRKTLDISVDSASRAELQSTLLYTERYL